MTNPRPGSSERVVRAVQTMRKHRGWSATRLAEECAQHGYPEITDQVIYNLEQGRRTEVTVDQLLAFSEALRVPMGLLLGPVKTGGYVLWLESEAERRALGEALHALRVLERAIVPFAPPDQEGT